MLPRQLLQIVLQLGRGEEEMNHREGACTKRIFQAANEKATFEAQVRYGTYGGGGSLGSSSPSAVDSEGA